MNTLRKLFPLALIALLFLVSCQKESIVVTEVIPEEVTPTEKVVNGLLTRSASAADGLELVCITIEYPFSMLLLDSSTVEIFSEDDFLLAIQDEDNFPIDFIYPVSVVDEDGNLSLVNDANELADLFVDCVPDTGWGDDFPDWFFPAWVISFDYSCYSLVYPVTLLDIDSVEVVAADEDELVELLSDGELYSFAFPITLEDEEGNFETAGDPEELFDLLSECSPGYGGGCGIGSFGCYEISYPATLILIDGSTVVVENVDEFAEVVMGGDWAGFAFPLTLIDEDGNEVTVNSDEELDALLLDCFGGFDSGFSILGCYEIEYPATLLLFDSSTVVVNNEDEFAEVIFAGSWAGFAYPLTLIDEAGNEIIVNSDEELDSLLMECFGGGTGGGIDIEVDFICYDIVYPIQVLDLMGDTVTINSSEEWEDLFFGPAGGFTGFVYPMTIINSETGEETVVNDELELIEAIEDCF